MLDVWKLTVPCKFDDILAYLAREGGYFFVTRRREALRTPYFR